MWEHLGGGGVGVFWSKSFRPTDIWPTSLWPAWQRLDLQVNFIPYVYRPNVCQPNGFLPKDVTPTHDKLVRLTLRNTSTLCNYSWRGSTQPREGGLLFYDKILKLRQKYLAVSNALAYRAEFNASEVVSFLQSFFLELYNDRRSHCRALQRCCLLLSALSFLFRRMLKAAGGRAARP